MKYLILHTLVIDLLMSASFMIFEVVNESVFVAATYLTGLYRLNYAKGVSSMVLSVL